MTRRHLKNILRLVVGLVLIFSSVSGILLYSDMAYAQVATMGPTAGGGFHMSTSSSQGATGGGYHMTTGGGMYLGTASQSGMAFAPASVSAGPLASNNVIPCIEFDTASTPLQKEIKQMLANQTAYPNPPAVTYNTHVVQNGDSVTVFGQTILNYSGPQQAGLQKWPDLIIEEPNIANDTNKTVHIDKNFVQPGNYTDKIINEHQDIYGPNGIYKFGNEPRTIIINENFNFTYNSYTSACGNIPGLSPPSSATNPRVINQPILGGQQVQIPQWLKSPVKLWSQGQVSDQEIINNLQYLAKQGILKVPPSSTTSPTLSNQIPSWVKTNAKYWSSGKISDNDFARGIQYLVSNGIIRMSSTSSVGPALVAIPHHSSLLWNVLMGFTALDPDPIKWGIFIKNEVCAFGKCLTLYEVDAGINVDFGIGLRLPATVKLDLPGEWLQPNSAISMNTEIQPKDFSASDYQGVGLSTGPPDAVYAGDEFLAYEVVFAGLKVILVDSPLVDYGIDSNVDVPMFCPDEYPLHHGKPCANFVTPFGLDPNNNYQQRFFPIPPVTLASKDTDLIIPIVPPVGLGVGIQLVPQVGSGKISAQWNASGAATNNGEVDWVSGTSDNPNPQQQISVQTSPSGNGWADIEFNNFIFHINVFQLQFNGRLELAGAFSSGTLSFLSDKLNSPWVKLFTVSLPGKNDIPIGQHRGTPGMLSHIWVLPPNQTSSPNQANVGATGSTATGSSPPAVQVIITTGTDCDENIVGACVINAGTPSDIYFSIDDKSGNKIGNYDLCGTSAQFSSNPPTCDTPSDLSNSFDGGAVATFKLMGVNFAKTDINELHLWHPAADHNGWELDHITLMYNNEAVIDCPGNPDGTGYWLNSHEGHRGWDRFVPDCHS